MGATTHTAAYAADLVIIGGSGGSAATSSGNGSGSTTISMGKFAVTVDNAAPGAAAGGSDGACIGTSYGGCMDSSRFGSGANASSSPEGSGGIAQNDLGFGQTSSGENGSVDGVSGAHGGKGADALVELDGPQGFNSITMYAGTGGYASGAGAVGGDGGNVTLRVKGDLNVTNEVYVAALSGGGTNHNSQRDPADQSGVGGQGGSVHIDVSGGFSIGTTLGIQGGSGANALYTNQKAAAGGDARISVGGNLIVADSLTALTSSGGEGSRTSASGHGGMLDMSGLMSDSLFLRQVFICMRVQVACRAHPVPREAMVAILP